MHATHGVGYEMNYQISLAAAPADLTRLASGSDSHWVDWTIPWHQKSFLKLYTPFRFYIPTNGLPHPSLTDVWITPKSIDDVFTTETLSLIADIWPRMVSTIALIESGAH